MKISFLILLSAGTLTACRGDSVVGPFGLRLRERPGGGSVAAAIRHEAQNHHYCPSVPTVSTGWTVRTLTKPAGRVSLPPTLVAASAPTSEVTFLAQDMTAGAFVFEAPSLASLEVPEDSPLSRSAITTCRVRLGSVESLVSLISQLHPARPGDSVHLAFLQVAAPGDQAVRAGAFAITRPLRDSLVGALLAFQLDLR
jgi:hypothetical protein